MTQKDKTKEELSEEIESLRKRLADLEKESVEHKKVAAELLESERKFRSLFENMVEGVNLHEVIYADDGKAVNYRILDVNPGFEKHLGVKADNVRGRLATDVYGTTDAPYLDIFEAVARTGQPYYFETYFPPLNKHFAVSVYSPKRGQFVTVYSDASERKRTENALKDSEERLRLALSGAKTGLFDINIVTGQVFITPEYATMFGYEPDKFQASVDKWRDSIHEEDREMAYSTLKDCISGQRDEYNIEYRYRTKSGDWKWVNSAGKVFFDRSTGNPSRLIGIHIDISKQKAAEQSMVEAASARAAAETATAKAAEVEAAFNELQKMQGLLVQTEKLSALGEMSAAIAHELNSPLAGILSIVRYHIKQKKLDDKEYGDLEEVILAAENMSKIIKELLEFSMPSSGQAEELSCADVITATLGLSKKIRSYGDVVVQTDFSKGVPKVRANRNQLQQIVMAVINNALDAMGDTGLLMISTKALSEGDVPFVEMEFIDSGSGIRERDLPKIFDPFFTTKEPGKGTGLGLSVAYSIIKRHHGNIIAESPPAGQATGTSIRIRLPAIK